MVQIEIISDFQRQLLAQIYGDFAGFIVMQWSTNAQQQLYYMVPKADKNKVLPDLKKSKKAKKNKNAPKFMCEASFIDWWVELTNIDGLNESRVLNILSETGGDVKAWPTEKHYCSWLGLSPCNKITGGKVMSSKTKPSANRAAAAFRLAAFALLNSKSALGAYCRRQPSRLGAAKTITATAHKIARIFYNMLKMGKRMLIKDRIIMKTSSKT